MTPGYIPPIRPSGTNSIEARVKALEVAHGYDVRDMQRLKEEVKAASKALDELQRKVAIWVISALAAAVVSLAMTVLKLKAPGLFTP